MKLPILLALAYGSTVLSAQAVPAAGPCSIAAAASASGSHSLYMPGETVWVQVQASLGSSRIIPSVTLNPSKTTGGSRTVAATAVPDTVAPKKLCFILPTDMEDELYSIHIQKVTPPSNAVAATGVPAADKIDDFTDLSPNQVVVQRPAITAISPTAAFADDGGSNKVAILGKGFCRGESCASVQASQAGESPRVLFSFKDIGTPPLCSAVVTGGCYALQVDSDTQVELTLKKVSADGEYYKGKKAFVIRVDGVDTAPATLALINTTANTPMIVAVIGFILVIVSIFLLLRSGMEATKQHLHGKTYWLSTLFLDVPTNTYSLSKCQFYAWTGASVLGYIFLAISKNYVQGSGVFPDIPSGMPGILIASAGTAVLSTGITSAKGDKGAGNPGPNLSDFIVSGGVVAADRLQFALWTVIGIATFLSVVFQSDPRTINDLPPIPAGFLELMGISSAGYLAGKIARKAGPSISNIVVSKPAVGAGGVGPGAGDPKLRFQITGSGLSRSALFSIDGKQIYPDTILGKGNVEGLPEVVQQDPTLNDPEYARVLAFSVDTLPDVWQGAHNFTITNPDAQKATWPYQVFKGTKAAIVLAPAPPTLTLEGECFDQNLTVQVVDTDAAATVRSVTPTEAQIGPARYVGTIAVGLTAAAGSQVAVTINDKAGVTQSLMADVS